MLKKGELLEKKEMDEIWQHFSTANLFGPHGPLTESGIELATFHHAVSHAAQSCVSKIDTAIASLTAEWAEHQRRQSVDPDDFLSLHTESPLPETFAHASPTLSPEERARYLTYQNIAVNASQIAASAQAPKDEHTGTGAIYKHDHVRRAFSMFVSNVISDGPEEIATALLQPMFQMTQVTMEGDPAPPADIAPVEAQSSQDLIKAYLRKPDAFALVRKFMTRPAERKDLPFDGPFDQPYFLNNDLTVARLCIPHTPAAPANASPPPLTRPMPMRPIVLQSVLSQPKNVGVGPHLFATGSAAATGGRSAALVASPRPAYFPSPNSSAVPTSFMALANTYFETPVIALPHAKPTTPWQIGIQAICDALEGIERGYQLPFTAHPVGVPTPTYRTHWELSSGIVSLGAAFPSLVLKQPGNSNRLKRAQVSIDNPDGKAAIATLLKDPWTGGPGSGKPQSSVHKLKVKLLEILYRLSGGENKSTKYIIADFLAIYKNFNCKEPDAHLSAEDEGSLHVQFKNYLNTKKYPPLVVDDFCEQLAQKIAQLKAHSRGMLTWGNLYTALIIEKPAHLAPKVYKFGQPNESIVIPSFDPYSSKITNDPLLLELGKRGFSGILGVFVNTLNAEGVRQARDIHLLLSQHLAQKNNVNPAEVPYFTYDALRGEFTAITPKILDALYFNVLLPAEIYLQCYSQVFSAAPKPTAPAPSIPLAVAKKRSPPKASPQLFNDIDLQDMKRVIPFFETLSHETKQEYLALLNRAQARAGGEPLDNQMKKFKKALEQKMPRRHVAVLMHLLKVIEEINLNTYNLDSAPPDFKKEKLDALLALVETLPSVINRSMTQIHLPSGRAFNNSDRIDMFREMLLTVAHLLSPDYIESLKNAYPKKADQVRFMSVLIQVLHETFRIPSKMLALQSTDHFLEFLKKQGTLEIAKIGEDTDDPYRRTAQAILTFIQNESALHAYFSDMMTTAIQTYFSGMPDLQAYFSAITEKMAKEYLVLREALLSRIRLLEINNPTEASLIELIKAATNAKKPPENLTLAENNALNAATAGKRKSAVIDDASSDEGSDKDAMQVVTAVPPIVKFSGENGSPAAQEPKTKKQKTRPASPPIS